MTTMEDFLSSFPSSCLETHFPLQALLGDHFLFLPHFFGGQSPPYIFYYKLMGIMMAK
jgi:hypothetical protein